ncbi:M91 family zinc metallopeptidase [Pyxidicoccus trucidator]|uniref:M91 family zinc metallopeptidase n=1 Tax=Pyxidicoccus trucidator TaxID=2709662 RepID=UPI0013DB020E|nr:M91 family zinc metallopeptidase [Pyxidicoccus trucidator]
MKLRSKPSFSLPKSSPSTPSASRPPSPGASAKPDATSAPKPSAPRPSPGELQAGKNQLKPTDYGVTHPDLQGIRTRRDSGQSGADFADFTSDVRNSTHKLMSKPEGHRLMTELNGRTQAVNPGVSGTLNKPVTVADISSGRNDALMPMAHAPRHEGTYSSLRPAYRYDGQPGAGRPSDIKYNEQAAGPRFNSLGHESVHAWRAANGLQVSPLAVSKHDNADVFQRFPEHKANMKDTLETRLRLTEEFETVGLRPTPHTPAGWAPSENKLRTEHGLPLRQDYSGMRPNGNQNDANLGNYDAGSDNRNFFQKLRGEPTPLGRILDGLEG